MTPPAATTTAAKARSRQAVRDARPRPARRGTPGSAGGGRRRSPQRAPSARRISGPAPRALPQLRPLPVLGTIGSHAFRAGRSLHDSPLLDRLMRGRGWIGLLGVLLFGLVALNVSLLKLNAEAGRNAEREKSLRVKNDRLRAEVAELASGERIEAAGMKLGLVMPEPKRVRYLSVGSSDARRAAKALRSDRFDQAADAAPVTPAPVSAPAAPVATGTATPGAPVSGTTPPTAAAPDSSAAPAAAGQVPPGTAGQAPPGAAPAGQEGNPAQPGAGG